MRPPQCWYAIARAHLALGIALLIALLPTLRALHHVEHLGHASAQHSAGAATSASTTASTMSAVGDDAHCAVCEAFAAAQHHALAPPDAVAAPASDDTRAIADATSASAAIDRIVAVAARGPPAG